MKTALLILLVGLVAGANARRESIELVLGLKWVS
jgi:hypothetical protein